MVSPFVAIERGRWRAIEPVIDHIEDISLEDLGLEDGGFLGIDVEISTQEVWDAFHLSHANEHRGDKPLICFEV